MDVEKVYWEDMSQLYQNVLHKHCICYAKSKIPGQMLDEIFGSQELRTVPKNDKPHELQLLSSAVIQLSVKLCLQSSGGYVCKEIASLAEYVISNPFLDTQVHHLSSSRNKFLHRAVLRTLTYSLYLLNEDRFSEGVKVLLDLLKCSASENSIMNLLNLFELIMVCSLKSVHVLEPCNVKCPSDEMPACKNQVRLSCCSMNDLKFKCCLALSHNWEDLVKKFFNKSVTEKSQIFIAFFCLWKSCLKAIIEHQDLKPMLFHNEMLVHLFVSLTPTEPASLKILLEVLIQSLTLEDTFLSHARRQNEYQGGKLFINAINSGLLTHLPIAEYNSGFGGAFVGARCKAAGHLVLQLCSKNGGTCDEITVKKIVLIVLKILSASKISPSVLTAFWNTEAFLRYKMLVSADASAYLWILDVFFDQDDLLIDALLCSLNLYMNLESTEKINNVSDGDVIKLRSSLNPHKAFINFLQRIGGDHHFMLDFLMSTDTHILNYLMQYLKLCLSEWEHFLSAHEVVEKCRIHSQDCGTASVTSEVNICDGRKCYSVADGGNWSLKENSCLSSSVPVATEKPQRPHLVSYSCSSSSSSDSELPPIPITRSDSLCCWKKMIAPDWTISILANLRQALEKLVGYQEFPYKINPLTELIRKCENMNKR